jgi:hydroxymethylbilane synthase
MSSAIQQQIRILARQRGPQKTFCPSEVARALFPDNWRPQMPAVRQAARQLAQAGEVRIMQSGQEVAIDQAKGPIRIQLATPPIKTRTAFITRDLQPGGLFRQQLEKAGWKASGQSLIHFKAAPFERVPAADWIFFYSKRAVAYFFEQLPVPLQQSVKLAAVGPGTAQQLRQQGVAPAFTGSGIPEEAARAFARKAKGQRVLFPQARHSRQSVQKALGQRIQAQTLVVYENEPLQDVPLSRAQVLVFTSPLNVEAYFRQHQLLAGQQAVAIGQPTAEALRFSGIAPEIAAAPDEEALAQAVLKLASA